MKRILFVGEANPYSDDPSNALYHLPREAAGNQLRRHLGLRDGTYAALPKINLCARRWSIRMARQILPEVLAFDIVVLLGARVREAVQGPEFFSAACRGQRTMLIGLPHPSGRCRLWALPGARQLAREILREHAPWIPWGES